MTTIIRRRRRRNHTAGSRTCAENCSCDWCVKMASWGTMFPEVVYNSFMKSWELWSPLGFSSWGPVLKSKECHQGTKEWAMFWEGGVNLASYFPSASMFVWKRGRWSQAAFLEMPFHWSKHHSNIVPPMTREQTVVFEGMMWSRKLHGRGGGELGSLFLTWGFKLGFCHTYDLLCWSLQCWWTALCLLMCIS